MIIGHRGASAVAPENTFAAFVRAIDQGADGIELDVRLSRDGVPVVIHDVNLKRTGLREEAVAHLTAKQLGNVDVGSWFNQAHPALARAEYSPQFIPTLDEVLNLFTKRYHRSLIYVEIKTDGDDDAYRDLVRSVPHLIDDDELRRRVVIISFDLKAVAEIKQIDPDIRTGALFEPKRNAKTMIRRQQIIEAAVHCGADEILLHRLIVTGNTVQLAMECDLRPVVWTVDDPKWLDRAAAFAIHALITNKPSAFRTSFPE